MLDPMFGDQAIDHQQQNRTCDRQCKAANAPTIHPAASPQCTTYESAYQSTRDTQYRGNDKTTRIASWHDQLGNGSRYQSKDDPTDNMPHNPPLPARFHWTF